MQNNKISLCIPTMDRFDNFLGKSLDDYIEYLKEGLIDEIVICDENGNDFDKINEKYVDLINDGINLRVFKNSSVLGVFLNKMKVCKMANNEIVALIDSDNFTDRKYFEVVHEYLNKKKESLPNHFVLSPSWAKPSGGMDARRYAGQVYTKHTVTKNMSYYTNPENIWAWEYVFVSLWNIGNFVLTKNIWKDITFKPEILSKIITCDVMYFNMLALQQLSDFQFHLLEGLEYEHRLHDDSIYVKHNATHGNFMWEHVALEYVYNMS